MYKIVGADGKEYGPVTLEQLKQWAAEGRINGQTRVETGSGWKLASDLPELSGVWPAARAPLSQAQAAPAAPGAAQPQSGLAITSLVLGIVSVTCLGLLAGIPAIICGHIARSRARVAGGQPSGAGMALAGLILGYLSIFVTLVILPALLLPALSRAKQKATAIQCMNNLKTLNLGLIMYASDHKDQLPNANWCDATLSYVKNPQAYRCSEGDPGQRAHYAFNSRLAGLATSEIQDPARTVLVFEIEGGWNASGGRELLLTGNRHHGALAVGFADGHVEMIRAANLSKLRWNP